MNRIKKENEEEQSPNELCEDMKRIVKNSGQDMKRVVENSMSGFVNTYIKETRMKAKAVAVNQSE